MTADLCRIYSWSWKILDFGLDKCPSHSGSLTKDVVPLFMPKTECNFHARKYLGLTITFKFFCLSNM